LQDLAAGAHGGVSFKDAASIVIDNNQFKREMLGFSWDFPYGEPRNAAAALLISNN
jgi:hypothetical protein